MEFGCLEKDELEMCKLTVFPPIVPTTNFPECPLTVVCGMNGISENPNSFVQI
jgi:hypothetical protein